MENIDDTKAWPTEWKVVTDKKGSSELLTIIQNAKGEQVILPHESWHEIVNSKNHTVYLPHEAWGIEKDKGVLNKGWVVVQNKGEVKHLPHEAWYVVQQ